MITVELTRDEIEALLLVVNAAAYRTDTPELDAATAKLTQAVRR